MNRLAQARLVFACLAMSALGGAAIRADDADGAAEPYCRTGWWNSPNVSACSPTCCVMQFAMCCDDYCRKPSPRIPCRPTSCQCDDYCRRPEPCVPRPSLTCVDDYCRKPLPKTCWPTNPHARCIPYCSANGAPDAVPPDGGEAASVPAAQRPRVVWVR